MTKLLDAVTTYAVYALIFIIPFSKAGIEIFATAAIIAWLIKQAIRLLHGQAGPLQPASYFPKTPLNAPIFVFFTISFISTIFSADFTLSLKGLFAKYAEYILLFFICVDVFSDEKRRSRRFAVLMIVFLSSAALLFTDAAFQWATGRDFIRGFAGGSTISGCFGNANDFAGYLITIIPIVFCMIFFTYKKLNVALKFIVKFINIILPLTAMVLLGKALARGAWIGFLTSAIFLMITGLIFIKEEGKKKLSIAAVIICIFVVVIASPIFIKSVRTRLATLKEGPQASWSRIYQWKEAIAIIEDFPILGTGPNTYTKIIPNYTIAKNIGCYPHNCYLQIAAETGVLGLLAFLWILWRLFSRSIVLIVRKNNMNILNNYSIMLMGILGGLLAFLVQSFFDTNLFALKLAVLFWVTAAIAVSLYIRVESCPHR